MRGMSRHGVLVLALAALAGCSDDPGPTSTAWDPDGSGPGSSSAAQDGSSDGGDETSSGSSETGASTGEATGAATGGSETSSGGETGEGDCPRVRTMTPGDVLNVRPTPDTSMPPVGMLPDGSVVTKVAEVAGETVNGNTIWFEIDSQSMSVHGYVSAEFVSCTTDPET